ncbi:MAG: tRNA(His) guanylyltransferase Thg1 family protein, partial [Methanobacteriaceae archaeon]|nr:tRNA(His) guanylyltransferase Thg1 family protein [Methanobacteriaceae archaeon]
MKNYEIYKEIKTPLTTPIIIRLDGRYFSNITKKIGLKKPFDERLADIFIKTTQDLIKEFPSEFIYTFSDEINILLTQIPFNGRIEKLNSIFASYTTGSFIKHLYEYIQDIPIISFDSRIIPINNDIVKYFQWRQKEAWRNCINGYAQYILQQKYNKKETITKLYKLKEPQLHDLLYENNISIKEIPSWQKRGIATYKEKINSIGKNPKTNEKNITEKKKIYTNE